MEKILYLFHLETILILQAKQDVQPFIFNYAIPINYEEQVPILIEIRNNASLKIMNYYISDDLNPPNRMITFNIASMKKCENITIHFDCWVLVQNKSYHDLPNVKITNKRNLPNDLQMWLASTEAIQSNNVLIKLTALSLKGYNKNLISLVKKTLYYVCFRKPFLTSLRRIIETNSILRPMFLPQRYWTGLMDAVSCLIFSGLCCAQSNLAVALLRANGIPARVLIVTAFGQIYFAGEKVWLDSEHYMLEFYCSNYGWIKCTPGRLGYQPKNYIISRIIYPKDEDIAGNGLSQYGGMEPWFWITDHRIDIVFPEEFITSYKKPKGSASGVPAIRLWIEKKIITTENNIHKIMDLTSGVWESFVRASKENVNANEKYIYTNAKKTHKKALSYLVQSDLDNYVKYLNIAQNNYKKLL